MLTRVQSDIVYKLETSENARLHQDDGPQAHPMGVAPPDSQEEPRTGSHTEFGVKQKGKGEKAKAICSGTFTGRDGDPMVPTGGRGVSRWDRGDRSPLSR